MQAINVAVKSNIEVIVDSCLSDIMDASLVIKVVKILPILEYKLAIKDGMTNFIIK